MIVDEKGNVLDHSGVKGMKWGVRRKQNRALNKAFTARQRQEHQTAVESARANIKKGGYRRQQKEAKAQFKSDKVSLGSREARHILGQKRMKIDEQVRKSQEYKNGKEVAAGIALAVGATILVSALKGAART